MENKRFSAGHLPYFTKLIVSTLWSPVILYLVLVGNLLLGASLMAFFNYEAGVNPEVNGMIDVIYWGFSTVTTVGYGDIVPVTNEGKIISVVIMLLGVSFFLAFTSIWVTSFLTKITGIPRSANGYEAEFKEMRLSLQRLEKLMEEKQN